MDRADWLKVLGPLLAGLLAGSKGSQLAAPVDNSAMWLTTLEQTAAQYGEQLNESRRVAVMHDRELRQEMAAREQRAESRCDERVRNARGD